jgi:uncharacterized membrane protein YadS
LVLSILMRGGAQSSTVNHAAQPKERGVLWQKILPWFIVGFLALMAARSAGFIPRPLLQPASTLANLLTIVSMAALGLGVDVRTVAKAGPRVTAAVVLSIVALAAISLGLIYLLRMQ